MSSHIEETNQALEQHLEQTKIRDAIVSALCGLVAGAMAYLLLGTGSDVSSSGISPSMSPQEGRPVLGMLAGLVSGAAIGWVVFGQIRQRRRRRFWGI